MKKLFLLGIVAALFLQSCGPNGLFGISEGKNGELTGVAKRPKWDNPNPYGMLRIPAGSFHMGNNEQDVNSSQIAYHRQVTMSSFYIDETEITNNEYRQFIKTFINQAPADPKSAHDSVITVDLDIYYPEGGVGQANYLESVYPDTLVWKRDFSYAYHDPLVENYWYHPAFDDYPVVGVSWYAAQAFCLWRTRLYNIFREKKKLPKLPRFRLPTEAEWEYAARGGFGNYIYPWMGPYTRNSKGCFLANFKPGRGDYIADNFEHTCPVKSYWPNDYGLYCMPGNVAEWCEDDFEESGYTYAHDLNPVYKIMGGPKRDTRKVIRGGSWKDVAYFLSVGSRTYEYPTEHKSFVGFRCVVSEIGRRTGAQL